MRRLTWLAVLALLPLSACGDDDSGDDGPSADAPGTDKVSEALTTGIEFDRGLLVKGSIPDASAQTVTLAQDDDVVRLKPGEASLMAIDVDNPDEADDPVEATLL